MDRSAIVLAGGFSSRFGQDKSVLELNHKPIIKHIVDAVKPVSDETIIVTSSQERADKYSRIVGPNVRFAIDLEEGKGPLVGALTGFECALGTYAFLMPVDVPFVSCDVVNLLFELCYNRSAVIPRWPNSQIEPLHAVYQVKTAIEAARIAVADGKLNVRAMIEGMRWVRYVSTLVIQELDPELRTFFNVNTPLELKRAEGLLRKPLGKRAR